MNAANPTRSCEFVPYLNNVLVKKDFGANYTPLIKQNHNNSKTKNQLPNPKYPRLKQLNFH